MFESHCKNKKTIELNKKYIKIFNKYNFVDSSEKNNISNSINYYFKKQNKYFQVFLPNTNKINKNLKEEEYNNFYLLLCNVNKKENECNILGYPNLFSMFFDSVEDVLGFVLSNERD